MTTSKTQTALNALDRLRRNKYKYGGASGGGDPHKPNREEDIMLIHETLVDQYRTLLWTLEDALDLLENVRPEEDEKSPEILQEVIDLMTYAINDERRKRS